MSDPLRKCLWGIVCAHEQLILQVLELDVAEPPKEDSRPAQTLEDWVHIYDGLSDEEIEKIDAIARTKSSVA